MSDEIDEGQVGGLGTDPARDAITQVDLGAEMQRSYLDYAMSVIVSRALPDVRDGMKPVHRRIIYAMWNGGYRPDRAFSKCAKVVGDVMGNYHPHGDTSIYDALVRLVQPWNLRYPLALGQGNFGSAGNDGAAAPRYTETKMAPLAMEMVRDIEQDSVDMMENYDGTELEPVVVPSRFPNLLVNGSSGIAVGMATNIPPHNLREVTGAVQWFLDNAEASREELLEASLERVKGPDFPNGAKILGRSGIEEAYRTGRGSIAQRAEVSTEEIGGRMCLVITELPYQVNPDALASKIADMVKNGRLAGIADIRDETSGRTGQRLVLVLKRDAVAKVVLNNLYKHTQLQENFSANMLALVDGTPRTLSLDMFIRAWVDHQIEVIVRRTQFRLRRAEEQMHIQRGLLLAINALDAVIATIRGSDSTDDARQGLIALLGVDETQANAILALQLRRLAALERLKIQADYDELAAQVEDYRDILATPARQRTIIGDELGQIVERFGDDRRTRIVPFDGDVADEDLIPEEQVVVTITRGGYAKRTREDQYRLQKRGGKGVRGAALRGDDVVDHFFTTSTHRWLLFFTNFGRVYRAKAYELPEASRDSKGQHVANLLAFQPGESIAGVLALQDFQAAEYLVLATRHGVVKKTALSAFDSNRSGGVIALNLRDRVGSDGKTYPDELVGATLANSDDHIILVSHQGLSVRFEATDEALRPMGRATSGVTGMKFREGDWLLTMGRVLPDSYLVTLTEGGYAKRTSIDEYRVQKRGGLGIKAARLSEDRGGLVGALIVEENDEIMVVMQKGRVVRSRVADIPAKGRDTMGVVFAKPDKGDQIIAVTHSTEALDDEELVAEEEVASEEVGGADGDEQSDALGSDESADEDGEAPADPSEA